MSKLYTPDQLDEMAAFYAEHGVAYLPKLADPHWVNRLLQEIDACVARPADPDSVVTFGRGVGRTTVRWLWRESAELRAFLFRAELAEVVARVMGSKEVRFWYDNTFIHESGHPGGGTPWHHDIAVFPLKGTMNPSLWLALTPADRNSSTLECIDGTHRLTTQYLAPPVPGQAEKPAVPGYAPLPDVDAMVERGEAKVLAWDVEPGDALLIHPYTLHGAKGNANASGRRVSFTTRWAGDDVAWKPDVNSMGVPGMDLAKVPVGAPPKGDFFPRLWPA